MAAPMTGWFRFGTQVAHYVERRPSRRSTSGTRALCGNTFRTPHVTHATSGPFCRLCLRMGAPPADTSEMP